jgi:type II secretory pathway component GspD/PulD (secretin)
MGLLEIIRNIVSGGKKINTKKLPSQGYFYPSDFYVRIKRATDEDVIDYEYNFNSENIIEVIESVKKIVMKNTIFSGFGFAKYYGL